MERSQTCSDCEKRPVSISVHTRRNGVRIHVDLCSACWLERYRSGELAAEKAETKKLGASVDLDLEWMECFSAETTVLKDVDLTT